MEGVTRMDVNITNREILYTVRRIDRNTKATRQQTEPKMPQLWAAAFGLLTCAMGTFVLERGNVPYLSPMYEAANDYVANNAATAGIWIGDMIGNTDRSMPDLPVTGGVIRGLDQVQTCRLMVAMRQRESSHNYQHPGNWAGYIGAYQFGASALATVGLIRQDAVDSAPKQVRQGLPPSHQIFMNNPSNWRLAGGKNTYLANPALQDKSFMALANANVETGFRSRALIKTNPNRIAGYVAAAHLKGSGAANSWYLRGKNSKDGNGTRTSDYAELGEEAIDTRSKYCQENTETASSWSLW